MYVDRHVWACIFMYVCMQEWVYIHMHVCMHVYQVSIPLLLFSTSVWHVTEQIWLPDGKFDVHSHYTKWAYRPTFAHTCAKTQILHQLFHMLLPYMCHISIFSFFSKRGHRTVAHLLSYWKGSNNYLTPILPPNVVKWWKIWDLLWNFRVIFYINVITYIISNNLVWTWVNET